jgi:hypothetical protein
MRKIDSCKCKISLKMIFSRFPKVFIYYNVFVDFRNWNSLGKKIPLDSIPGAII